MFTVPRCRPGKMCLERSKSVLLWFLFVVAAHVTEAAGRMRMKLAEDEVSFSRFRKTSCPGAAVSGPEPGELAAAFTVPTLDGEFVYEPGALNGSVLIHAFTSKSGFLECLWSSESSLSGLEELPDSAQILFLSLDDSAAADALWMQEQLHRAAAHR